VDQVESLLRPGATERQPVEDLNIDMGLIPLLAFVARHSSEMTARQRAIDLLKQSQRVEGIWNSRVAVYLMEKIIVLEERAIKYNLPFRALVEDVALAFSSCQGFSVLGGIGKCPSRS